jgi:hypothetical protein
MFKYSYKCAACLLRVNHSQIDHYEKIKAWSKRNPSIYDNEAIRLREQIERGDQEIASLKQRIFQMQKNFERGKIGKLKQNDNERRVLPFVNRNKTQDPTEP